MMNDDITARGGRARHGRRFGLLVAALLARPLAAHAQSQTAAHAQSQTAAHAQSQTAAHAQSQTAPACPAGNGLFVLYYGAVQNPASTDATMQTIESERPGLVVFGDGPGAQRSRGDIPSYVHQDGGKALMYVALGYGANDPTTVDGYVTDAMNAGYDGIFFDEAATDSATYQWNSDRAAHVKSFGASKLVVMNPGTVPPNASMFDYADIVSVENQYTQQLPATWGIPSWRWLAVQGDPASAAATSAAAAENRLTTFRGNGGYWYYSSAYASSGATAISLPSWYTTFATWAGGQADPSCPASVDVKSMGAVGDGSTDDTAAFHHAIDALTAAGGGTLVMPPGVYNIKPSSLTFPSNITVAGNAATLRANAVGFSLVDVAGTNITVSGVTFDGAGLAVQGINIDAGSSNVTMRDSTVAHLRQPADATLYPDLYGAMPVGVFVRGDGHTITLDNMTIKDIVADHNDNGTAPSRVARGVLISPGGGQHITTGVTVRNSAFDGVGPIDDGDCVVMQDSADQANLQVVHNTFTGCAKRAIKIQTPGALIEDNTITNSFLGNNPCYTCSEVPSGTPLTYDMYAGISVYQYDVRVEGNTIGGVGSYYNGIELGDGVHPLTGVVIQSNTVSMGAASNISAPSSLIRDFGPDTSPTITGNTLSHAAYGLYVSGPVSSPVVLNNAISDVTYPTYGLPARYTVTDLGAFTPTAINASGQIAGSENSNAALYSGGMTTYPPLDRLYCYPVPCGSFGQVLASDANGIDSMGRVVGDVQNTSGTTHGYYYLGYDRDGIHYHAFDVGTLPGNNASHAFGVNDAGKVVGESSGGSQNHAFVWWGAKGLGAVGITDLGTLPGGNFSTAHAINASGQVAGWSNAAGSSNHAVLWSASGGMTDLGTLPGGSSSYADAINASGQVAGWAVTASQLGSGHAFLYSGGAMSDLGTLGGSSSAAAAINTAGQIVGFADTPAGTQHAFLYTGGAMNDLNSLIPAGSGWELQRAAGINDAGQIVGTGTINGQTHGFLLSVNNPTPSISNISPTSAPAGSASDLTLTVRGSAFINGSTVEWDDAPLPTTFVDGAQLTAVVTASSLLTTAGTAAVTVSSPAPGGGASTAQMFFVTATGTTVTGVDSAVSASSTGTAIAATGETTATATGIGTVTVAQYAANPVMALPPNPVGAYFDVNMASGSLFSALTLVDCNLGGGDTVYWWDASAAAWSLVSNQTYDAATRCVTITLNGVSAPSTLQLTGTPFVAVRTDGSGSGNGNLGTATPELGSGELLATGLLGLAGIALHALHRRRRKVNRRGQGRVRLLISARVIRNAPV